MKVKIQQLHLQIRKQFLYRHLNLQFQAGEIWGILGANGCGKTTLLYTLAGLLPARGHISLNNISLHQLKPKERAKQLGLLFQETVLPPLQTVFDYVFSARYPHLKNAPTSVHTEIVMTSLQQFALTHHQHRLLSQLSGGEKRRAAIASLFAQTPVIYLLDEPTNHLDIRYQIGLLRHLQTLAQLQKIIIMSLHDLQQAQIYCTHVLLLLPDGCYLQGKTADCLTAANLTTLYGHNITNIGSKNCPIWQPVY